MVLSLIEILHSTTHILVGDVLLTLTMYLQNTPQFNNCWVLVHCQVTIQNVPEMSSTSVTARMNKSDNGQSHHFKGPRAVANGLTDIKTLWWSGCSLSIGAEYTRGLQVSPQIKNVSG
jgi:hypothetical protein